MSSELFVGSQLPFTEDRTRESVEGEVKVRECNVFFLWPERTKGARLAWTFPWSTFFFSLEREINTANCHGTGW